MMPANELAAIVGLKQKRNSRQLELKEMFAA
jgi:hypothetical protein